MKNTIKILVALLICAATAQGQTCYIITTITGNGTGSFTGDGGPASAATINVPQGIVFDNAGNLIFADWGNQRIRKISPGGIITTIAGTGVGTYTGDGGPATAATFQQPTGLAIDTFGNIYFTDPGYHVVRKINTSGIISTIAGTGTPGYTGDGGPATAAELNHDYYLAFDKSWNLLIADVLNNRVRQINSSGVITTIAGTGGSGFSGDGGPATAAMINQPGDVAVDSSGIIYISGAGNRIRKVDTAGIITEYAGTGISGYSGDGGPATAANINCTNLSEDFSNNLCIADQTDHHTRIIDMYGTINNFAGTGVAGFSGDGGPATAAQLNGPWVMVSDHSGNYYISDQNNNRIRKIVSSPGLVVGASTVCVGSTITLTDMTTGGTWSSSGTGVATVGSSTGIVMGVSAGTVIISYTATTVCGMASITRTITVNPLPNAGTITGLSIVNVGSSITLTDTAAGGIWSTSNGNATIGLTGIATGVAYGIDTIYYIKSNGCGSDTAKQIITIPNTTGVYNIATEPISIYPNPARASVSIMSSMKIEKVEVFNTLGQKLITQKNNSSNLTLNINELLPGLYTIRINGSYVRKLLKE